MWALFGVSIRSVLKAPRNQRIFNLVMGAILLLLAVLLLR
jgi:threonine/homoserine/homoserine lactone efflux protein